MAVKPIVNRINTFDPAYDYKFSFSYSGNQSHSNRLVITDNETNAVVYDKTITTMKLEQVLPGGIITSGKQYSAQFQSIDVNNVASPISDKAYFYCLKTPVFRFTNMTSKVENASYEFVVEYSQAEGEYLKEYEFILWNSGGSSVVKTSGLLYADAGATSISYNFTGLENNEIYNVQVIGSTVNGLAIDTGKSNFAVTYIQPSYYSTFYVENDYSAGVIKCNTNIIMVNYNGNEIFDYYNGKIVLINQKLYYDDGFLIPDDCAIKIKGKYFLTDANLFMASNGVSSFYLKCIECGENSYRFILTVENGISPYVLISAPVIAGDHDIYTVVINRKNNLYGLNISIEASTAFEADFYIGNTLPTLGEVTRDAHYIYDPTMATIGIEEHDIIFVYKQTEPANPEHLTQWLYEEGK